MRDWVAAGSVAAAVSGLPSTAAALATGGDPLEATLAAGSVLLPDETRRSRLVVAALPVHVVVSFGWAYVLARILPRRRTVLAGALAGLGIAALDLGVAARRFPRVDALPLLPQLADHVLYGLTVGRVLDRARA